MKVNLNIEEDDMFRSHVKALIEGQVRHILREQLTGIVAGEIAKLRLLQPGNPTLSEIVGAEVTKQTRHHLSSSNIANELRTQCRAELEKHTAPVIKELRDSLKQAVIDKVRTA